MRKFLKNAALVGCAVNVVLIPWDILHAIQFRGESLEHTYMGMFALAAFSFFLCFVGYWNNRDA